MLSQLKDAKSMLKIKIVGLQALVCSNQLLILADGDWIIWIVQSVCTFTSRVESMLLLLGSLFFRLSKFRQVLPQRVKTHSQRIPARYLMTFTRRVNL